MTEMRRQKLKYFGHVVRAQNFTTSILHGRVGKLEDVEDLEDAG